MESKIELFLRELETFPHQTTFEFDALLQKWQKQFPSMDKEEALIRLLHEISKE